jgi:hypothetical protein
MVSSRRLLLEELFEAVPVSMSKQIERSSQSELYESTLR